MKITRSRVIRLELSAIYLMAALLCLSIGGLIGNAIAANGGDAYPNLYVVKTADFETPTEKTVYFTFDDGPSPNTAKVLDALKGLGIPGTFFVTAQNADELYAEEMLRRIVDEGHSLGLHSYSHNFQQIYRSPESYLDDLDRLNEYLYETVGVRPRILRFPGGSATVNASPSTMKALITELTRRGYLYYDWDVVSGDDTATVYDPGYLADRMVSGAAGRDRVVILLHDSPAPTTTARAVELAAERFREIGYTFDKLTEQVEPVHIQTNRLD